MKILISGASGLIGLATANYLRKAGHTIAPLVRPTRAATSDGVRWDPDTGDLDTDAADVVIAIKRTVDKRDFMRSLTTLGPGPSRSAAER